MENERSMVPAANRTLETAQVYAMAVLGLAIGLAIGYLLKSGPQAVSGTQPAVVAAQPSLHSPHPAAMGAGHMPTAQEMKQMADKQAAPLLEKLKADPKNTELLSQLAAVYNSTHQFNEAAVYYAKIAQVDPKNVAARTKLAGSLYYGGDVDGAIRELNKALAGDPDDVNALFNLGLIKLQGKQDAKGALAAWQRLLKAHPELSPERRATVEKLMAQALNMVSDEGGMKGAPAHDGH
jgi:cytochrome c-type biogenesis protein CcmH/NrfG